MRQTIQIIDCQTGQPIDAEIFDEITLAHFIETQADWRPVVLEAARALAKDPKRATLIPSHFHWDWTRKEAELKMLALRFYGISCKGRLQGIMKVDTVARSCRLPEQQGKPLVYIDYIEAAPWNIKQLMEPLGKRQQFRSVGTRLFEAAVLQSDEEGFKGRLGLHSLPGSEGFYVKECGMTPVGRDPHKQNLLWCEFTPEQAHRYLAGE
jgi:hypothetical protein